MTGYTPELTTAEKIANMRQAVADVYGEETAQRIAASMFGMDETEQARWWAGFQMRAINRLPLGIAGGADK